MCKNARSHRVGGIRARINISNPRSQRRAHAKIIIAKVYIDVRVGAGLGAAVATPERSPAYLSDLDQSRNVGSPAYAHFCGLLAESSHSLG
jgi:hypothetical protein